MDHHNPSAGQVDAVDQQFGNRKAYYVDSIPCLAQPLDMSRDNMFMQRTGVDTMDRILGGGGRAMLF